MAVAIALFAGATLRFIPLGNFVRRLVTDSPQTLDMPPLPAGSPEDRA